MSKIYSKYVENCEHVWYDSSNIVYSVCFDKGPKKSLKIVFKGGRTYLYKDVDPLYYTLFRDAESNGKEFNTHIKNYECVKQDDTNIDSLEKLKKSFVETDTFSEYKVHIDYNNMTGEFKLSINGNPVYEEIEGQVSVINLLRAMGIEFTISEAEVHLKTVEEFNNQTII